MLLADFCAAGGTEILEDSKLTVRNDQVYTLFYYLLALIECMSNQSLTDDNFWNLLAFFLHVFIQVELFAISEKKFKLSSKIVVDTFFAHPCPYRKFDESNDLLAILGLVEYPVTFPPSYAYSEGHTKDEAREFLNKRYII